MLIKGIVLGTSCFFCMWSPKQGRAFMLHNPFPHKHPIDFSRGSVHGLLMRYDPSQLVFGSTFFCVVMKMSLWFA